MKLSTYAKKKGISYLTALRHWQKGYLQGEQLASGTIIIFEAEKISQIVTKVILYARVSSGENKSNLEAQLERLRLFAAAKGYEVKKEVKEIGSGLNDKRPLLEKILVSNDWDILVVEHKDRLARFGINYMSVLLEKLGKKIEIINTVQDSKDDLMQDFVSIITSFTARLYGLRRSKRKTEELIKNLASEIKSET
jgi:predicted site-specific integrase-resolvase